MKNYALIRNNIVDNVIVIAEPTEELLQQVKELHAADLLIEADENACIGGEYDGTRFWTVQPFPSWVKNEETGMWNAPVPYPADEKIYAWSEIEQAWKVIQ